MIIIVNESDILVNDLIIVVIKVIVDVIVSLAIVVVVNFHNGYYC